MAFSLKSFSQSLEQFFFIVGRNNVSNKIQFLNLLSNVKIKSGDFIKSSWPSKNIWTLPNLGHLWKLNGTNLTNRFGSWKSNDEWNLLIFNETDGNNKEIVHIENLAQNKFLQRTETMGFIGKQVVLETFIQSDTDTSQMWFKGQLISKNLIF